MLSDTTKLFCIKELSLFCEYSGVNIPKGTTHIFSACIIISKVLCQILHDYTLKNENRARFSLQK